MNLASIDLALMAVIAGGLTGMLVISLATCSLGTLCATAALSKLLADSSG